MIEKNRKAIVSRDGRSIAVLGKDGKEWRLCPASFCAWAARDPKKRGVVGFGDTVWMAIRNVAVE
jgi:transposase